MVDSGHRWGVLECRDLLIQRLEEPAPGRIQLLAGPRQVGKTTLMLQLAAKYEASALYVAADGPEAAHPGFWERLWARAEEKARSQGLAVVLLDEVHVLPNWAALLKGEWDRLRRRKVPVHIVATGSSALRVATGARESLAGRFERLTLSHWSAESLARVFGLSDEDAVLELVRRGSYPGAYGYREDHARWFAYVRDAILEPAIGKDVLALASVRRPALLRQVFGVCATSPAQIVSLQKIQGQLQDAGALETIAHYLSLLEEAFLVASLRKHSTKGPRSRSAPPKLVTLNNALLAVMHPGGEIGLDAEPARLGAWVENACLAHAWNSGQQVEYWREEPFEVDGILDGNWGPMAIEIKTGALDAPSLRGLLEFTRRYPRYRPLLVGSASGKACADRSGIEHTTWQDFLLRGPPGS